ncbi:hypothetical protein SEA_RIPARIAN_62 [Mycobacterium phage Riparian]|uniref:Uncharacterized protein n=3 Tax=Papyrusvirus send513 TaxID=1982556 RepID=A0A2P1JQM2_9CAUD|nr:hypothetical protein SEA_ZENON_61 [Mycobacterium phage Zenon]AVO21459.1 hypothetical protein PBI_NILO_62 [Mycobacterium phage Nilo]AYQ98634.1 hypothetical protein SEA_RIPARIAN_62 [Mycobacterium phage Riparian]
MNKLRKLLRAYRVSQHRRRLNDEAHIAWARSLLAERERPVD